MLRPSNHQCFMMDDVEKEEDNNIGTKHFKIINPFTPKIEIFKFFQWDLYVLPRKSQGTKYLKTNSNFIMFHCCEHSKKWNSRHWRVNKKGRIWASHHSKNSPRVT